MMTSEYEYKAHRTINHSLSSEMQLANAALGLAGEAGEFADLVKKILCQGKGMDKEKLKDELGDVCWYIALACYELNMTMEDVMKANLQKLKIRYPDGFSNENSEARVDVVKDEEQPKIMRCKI